MKRKDMAWFALFTMPLLFIFTTVVIIPFFFGIYYSFFNWNGVPTAPKMFVGFENYVQIFQDTRFLNSSLKTLQFTIIALVTVNVFGLAFAFLVTSKLRTAKAARIMLFMPNLIGGLILGYIWSFILSDGFKTIGEATGLNKIFFNWLIDPDFALFAMIIVITWQMAGYMMIIYIAGLQGIPNEVLEAATVDGAVGWQKLSKITFPLLMPSFTICLFMTLSSAFKIFDVNISLTKGGPANATEMFAMNIYNEIFGYNNYGYGQAKAIIFLVVASVITLTQVYITKKREVEA